MHDAISVPVQPDAPLTVNASSNKSVGTASELPLAPTDSDVAGDDTVMPDGRDARDASDVAHEVVLMVRVQVAASCDSTRNVGAGDSSPPGSAVSVVDDGAQDTANVAGYVRLTSSVDAAPAALTTTTDTTG